MQYFPWTAGVCVLGSYKSRDGIVTDVIQNYKLREEIYEDTISKLQEGNRGLLEEILNLKEEIVTIIRERNCSSSEDR